MKTLPAIAALGACMAASGCVTAAVGAGVGVGVMAAQDRSFGQGIDDTTASTIIKTRLLTTDRRGFSGMSARIAEGRVLLTGVVPTEQHRQDAERIAWSASQVQEVINELQVGPRPGLMRVAADDLISTQVRARFVASSEVKGINISIETFEGVVYLLGVARTQEELEAAAQTASIVPGVKRVVSYLELVGARREAMIAASRARTPLEDGYGQSAGATPLMPEDGR